ncbi:FAD-dependent oxidoreductase [Plantibacter sp. YIM 135347]|uniref:FAD-dependent oxidoreductase n=1 Tax=Plantibacter sp. YIM 135347 TaxID=3423919 RepID=UPI003D32E196
MIGGGRLAYLFDTVLGRVTMYRLVTLSLGTLALYAFILSLLGKVFYTPLELLATAAVLIVVGYGGNRLFGALFRVRPHGESAVITSLLLFFILWPSTDPLALLWIALASLIAQAGKYVLVFRKRHIVNPTVVAAAVMSVSGLSPSVWWAASPYLLPAVVVLGFLVLYRTRRLAMAGTFIVVAWALVTIRLAASGQELGAAALAPLTSYPIVFLAAFMLSEPLTLPPRRWQQLVEAVLVGVVFAVPYAFGPVFSTPELALLVGNLFAFAVSRRSGIRLRLDRTTQLTPTAVEYSFTATRPVSFVAGQYLELTLPHRRADVRGTRRTFSIVSPPEDGHTIRVAMRMPERASSFKRALATLPVGGSVSATGVWGDFVLPADETRPLLLIAAGIGITPFASQLAQLHVRRQQRDIVLVYVVSGTEELAYAAELQAWGVRVFVAAPVAPEPLPAGWTYLGPGRIDHERLVDAVPDFAAREVLISGPPTLIDALKPALRGVGATRVRTDAFSGY